MSIIERKSMPIELSDMDREHRTAVIAHAVYNNIDRFGDISRKGMFDKSWRETKASDIYFNIDHDMNRQPEMVVSVFESEHKAFTKVKFSGSTLGNDTMIMMDEGIMRGASFEFTTMQKATIEVKGKKVRELKEVRHLGSTVTYALPPVNPEAGVITVTKADVGALVQFKAHIDRLEAFCRNTKASDETIKDILTEVKAARELLSSYDTAATQQITEPPASSDDSLLKQLLLFNAQLSLS